jgi:hypothetical protein
MNAVTASFLSHSDREERGMRPDFLDSATVLNTVEGLSSEIYADLVHSEDVAVCAWLQERFSVSTDFQELLRSRPCKAIR